MNQLPLKTERRRPTIKPYFWVTYYSTAFWSGLLASYLIFLENTTSVKPELAPYLKPYLIGLGSILTIVALAYAAVWAGRAIATVAEIPMAAPLPEPVKPVTKDPHRMALEIRGAGLAVGVRHQSNIWRLIQQKNSNVESIYSQNPKDYPALASRRTTTANINTRVAFRHSAGEAVPLWPLPTFAVSVPKQPRHLGAQGNILSGRNAATLGVTLFLWQDAENTTHAQGSIERLFQFFDDNPSVPQALITSKDGDTVRSGHREPGTPRLPDGHYVPRIFESVAGLLLSRTDTVNQFVRAYALNEGINNQDRSSAIGMLWFFYWQHTRLFDNAYESARRAEGIEWPTSPGVPSTAYWQAQLPALWEQLGNQYGPGGRYTPTPWLPIRWARGQLKSFDNAPVLGFLHRPVKAPMVDLGRPLKPALRAKALQIAWERALATLPNGEKPVRVFYDSTDNSDGVIALSLALHALNQDGNGLALSDVNEGYDIGRRLGNTGVSSALVQINLASIASYHSGGVSAVVYSGSDGSATVQMVRPPDADTKGQNNQRRGNDPFTYGAPR